MWNFTFFFNSTLLGAGLAADAFSVSLANGLNETTMTKRKACLIAGTFALFQFAMPMIGWACVSSLAKHFAAFEKLVPWIALFLLCFIGGKMFFDGIKNESSEEEKKKTLGPWSLFLQGIATSIDALSVGFTIAEYALSKATICCSIIAAVTFVLCVFGLAIGKKFGTRLAGKASVLGGIILIAIGIEIFVTGMFF